jgi:hypothetical protein
MDTRSSDRAQSCVCDRVGLNDAVFTMTLGSTSLQHAKIINSMFLKNYLQIRSKR